MAKGKPMVRLSKEEIRKKQEFIEGYMLASNAASASAVDANANVGTKTVATLGAELWKDCCIQVNRQTLYDYIEKNFDTESAQEYVDQLEEHLIYKHDESSPTPGTPYTYSSSEVVYVIYKGKEYITSFEKLYNLCEEKEEIAEENNVWIKYPVSMQIADKDGFTDVTRLVKKVRHRKMVYVSTEKGNDLLVTDNHPIIIDDYGNTIEAEKAINSSMFSCELPKIFSNKKNVEIIEEDRPNVELNEEFGLIIGTCIVSGFYGDRKDEYENSDYVIKSMNKDLCIFISDYLWEKFRVNSSLIKNNIDWSLYIYGLGFTDFLKNKLKINNKSLPDCLSVYPIEFFKGILKGIYQSISTSSREFKNQLVMYLNYFGFSEDYGWKEVTEVNDYLEDNMPFIYDITTETHTFICNGVYSHNCLSISMYPFLEHGMKKLGGESDAPHHLESFCGSFINLVFACSSQIAGAIATAEVLLYFHYFAQKEYGKDFLKTHTFEIDNQLQSLIYSLNQPAASRGYQAIFFNCSVFDKYYFESMFGNFYFPDGTHITYEEFNPLQKHFMEWLRKERTKALLTFPVLTEASLDWFNPETNQYEPKDKEWAEWCAEEREKGLSFFSFNDTSASALASCCFHGDEKIYIGTQEKTYFTTIKDFVESYIKDTDTEKKINGVFIYSYNPDKNIMESTEITGVLKKKNESKKLVKITCNNSSIQVTFDHKFIVFDNENYEYINVTARELYEHKNRFDIPIVNNQIIYQPIQKIEIIDCEDDVYDIELKENHYFSANNIISHNCRLRNEIDENDFSFSLGAGGIQTGSTSVMTINLNRFIQKVARKLSNNTTSKRETRKFVDENWDLVNEEFFKELELEIKKVQKWQYCHRLIVQDYIKAGLLPIYNAGFINIDKQFLTMGINGHLEAAQFMNLDYKTANEKYLNWMSRVLGTFKRLNLEAKKIYNVKFNTEQIPAENVAHKFSVWDKKDNYEIYRDVYSSYIYDPAEPKTTIVDKFKMHGALADSMDGGSALHCNLSQLPDKELFLWLRQLAAKYHCTYWTTNVKTTICKDCGHIDAKNLEECPECHSTNLDKATRIIGYLIKVSNFSEARQKEEATRIYH